MENEHNKLYPEDQARVDAFLRRGYNETDRKPFRPLKLLFVLLIAVSCLSVTSLLLAWYAGVY